MWRTICVRHSTGCATGLNSQRMRQAPDSGNGRGDIDAAVQETDRLIGTFNSLLLIAEAEAGSVRETMANSA